jgi:hypothetical protein
VALAARKLAGKDAGAPSSDSWRENLDLHRALCIIDNNSRLEYGRTKIVGKKNVT